MSHRMICALAAFHFAIVIAVADDTSNEVKNLQGTWQAVEIEANGQKSPTDQVSELKIVIQGNEVYALRPIGEDPRSKFKLDPNKQPKAIDLFPLDSAHPGRMVAGIYSLQNGQLRLCINLFGKDTTQRPKGFKTMEGDGVGFVTLERVKPK